MDTFWLDVKQGIRTLVKTPGFALIAVLTLAPGLAVNTTIFTMVNSFILRPLPVAQPEQLTVVAMTQKDEQGAQKLSFPDFQDLREQAASKVELFAYRISLASLAVDGKGDHCILSRVTDNYFPALGIQAAEGRLLLPTEGRTPDADRVAVLGYSYWQRRFGGDKSVIGKHAEMNGHPLVIVGVAPKEFKGTYAILDMDVYVPLSLTITPPGSAVATAQEVWTKRDLRDLRVMGRLQPGVTLRETGLTLNVVAQRIAQEHPDTNKGTAIQIFPEKLARPEPDPEYGVAQVSVIFLALALLVLLVACFNVANVLLVRATVRQREMAIRAALGAGRVRLARQFLTESLLVAILGGGVGVFLASLASSYLGALSLGTPLPLHFDFRMDGRVVFFSVAAVVLTSTLIGLLPALRVARADVNSVLHEGGRGSSDGPKRLWARNALVVSQVAGSLVLLVVAGLFVRSLEKTRGIHLGFNPEHVLNVTTDVQQIGYDETRGRSFYREMEARVRALPGVTSVAQAFSVPMGVMSSADTVYIPGKPVEAGKPAPTVQNNPVTPSYFETMQIPLLRGRIFTTAEDEKARPVAVINQTMAKQFWPNDEAVGKTFRTRAADGPLLEVVGVVQDCKYRAVVEDPAPFYYLPVAQNYVPLLVMHIRTAGRPEDLQVAVENVVHGIAPDLPITQVQTMRQALEGVNGFFFFELGAQLATTMGLLGLILAVVGVYGVVSYSASQRAHEIGIRMALGASPGNILKMILRQSAVTLGIGLAIGVAAAFASAKALASLFVGVKPADPLTFAGVVVLLSGVALLACWIPARRATQVDPLTALRYE